MKKIVKTSLIVITVFVLTSCSIMDIEGLRPKKGPPAEAPTITLQPVGKNLYVGGSSEALVVNAKVGDGGILSYQWYMGTSSGGPFTIVGTDNNSFLLSNSIPTDAGTFYYTVEVTNTKDGNTAKKTSDTVQVKVKANAPISWSRKLTFGININAITSSGLKCIAVGDYNRIINSNDNGYGWTTDNGPLGTNDNIYAICRGNGFIVGGSGGNMAHSPDGIAWTLVNSQISGDIYTIVPGKANNKDVYIAGGANGKMSWSENGTVWIALNSQIECDIYAIAWGEVNSFFTENIFIVGGSNGKIFYSNDDLASWNEVIDSTFGNDSINDIIFIEDGSYSKFIAVGDKGKIASSSSNGYIWTPMTSPFGSVTDINAIAYGVYDGSPSNPKPNEYILGGSNGQIAWSNDGSNWYHVADSDFGSYGINDIIFIEYSGIVFVGDNGRIAVGSAFR